jgi:hypothetical protein
MAPFLSPRVAVVALTLGLLASSLAIVAGAPFGAVSAGSPLLSGAGAGPQDHWLGPVMPDVDYAVTFNETGLPANLTWQITLGRTTSSYYTDGGNDTLSFNEPNGVYSYSILNIPGWKQSNLTYTGSITVSGQPVFEPTLVYTPVTYNLTFTETGLPTGTNWTITLGAVTLNSTTTTIAFTEPNGTYTYSVGVVAGYAPSAASGMKTVAGENTGVTITFHQVTYGIEFSETGLTSGTRWSITVDSDTVASTSSSLQIVEPNGTYTYQVNIVSGFMPTSPSGMVTVNGTGPTVDIVYSPVTYTVTFTASGLPTRGVDTRWSVALDGVFQSTVGSSLMFQATNGSHTYLVQGPLGFEASAIVTPEGTIGVSGGPASQAIIFLRGPTYVLNFREIGLATGTRWCVSTDYPTCGTTALLSVKNLTPGTYGYAVGSFAGYTTVVTLGTASEGATGSASVGPSHTFVARFALPVTFTESGLPGGTSWTVASGGHRSTSTTDTNVVYLTNGTYGFTVIHIRGYRAVPATGRYSVAGGPVSVAIRFSVVPAAVPVLAPSPSGLAATLFVRFGSSERWAL